MSAQSLAILELTVTSTAAILPNRAVNSLGAPAQTDLYGIAKTSNHNIGDEVPVVVVGTAIVEAGGAIPAGTPFVIADALGRAVVGGTPSSCLGKPCRNQAAVNPGDLIEVLLCLTV